MQKEALIISGKWRKKMNKNKCVLNSVFILLFVFTGFSAIAQEPEFSIPDLKTHYIKSTFVDQEFIIFVSMPIIHDEESERFPVLYCPDANFSTLEI